MGLRFRKSFKLAPGIRMTLGGRGASLSLGPRGATIGIGKRGVYSNVSAFGLSSRTKLSGPSQRSAESSLSRNSMQRAAIDAKVGMSEEGELFFTDSAGNQLPESWVKSAKAQHADAIRLLIQAKCDMINEQVEAVGDLHLETPAPSSRPSYVARDYIVQKPDAPKSRKIDFLARIFTSRRKQIEAENNALQRAHETETAEWVQGREAHRQEERARRICVEELIYTDVDAMEDFLEESLQDIAWPRETLISTEIRDEGRLVCLDVDLPEIEDMPSSTAAIPQRGMKLSIKTLPPTQRQKLYMKHVHAIGFRIIGEAFASLPVAQQIVVSAYSQRRDKVTGQMQDEYLYSVRVERSAWSAIDFSSEGLKCLDVVEALTRFELRRVMSKTGVFKPIIPLSA